MMTFQRLPKERQCGGGSSLLACLDLESPRRHIFHCALGHSREAYLRREDHLEHGQHHPNTWAKPKRRAEHQLLSAAWLPGLPTSLIYNLTARPQLLIPRKTYQKILSQWHCSLIIHQTQLTRNYRLNSKKKVKQPRESLCFPLKIHKPGLHWLCFPQRSKCPALTVKPTKLWGISGFSRLRFQTLLLSSPKQYDQACHSSIPLPSTNCWPSLLCFPMINTHHWKTSWGLGI